MRESLLMLTTASWLLLLLFAGRIALHLRQFDQQVLQALLLLLFLALVRLWNVVIGLTAAGSGHRFAIGHGLLSGSRVLVGRAGAEDTLRPLCH